MKRELTSSEELLYEEMLGESYSYEKVRVMAVEIFNRGNKPVRGISERCYVFINLFRATMFEFPNEEGLEPYFSYEIRYDDIPEETAIAYKKAFVKSFEYHLKHKLLTFPISLVR